MEKMAIFPFSDLRLKVELNKLVSASIIEATFGPKVFKLTKPKKHEIDTIKIIIKHTGK
ncbi:hypothetical protein SAMN04487988_10227 [Algoriphagus hitonicola]|uniref:Uncharacterized protein n=1 Tax=Algoriphagus hitonicola TaxID=435880 RepID=A0A1I2PXJ7_9BACT|nr:hypothetical protein SAMN04487988_10227 [Algoriphagus hitonicola]